MNERIKELARQAEEYASANEEHWHDGPDWQDLFNEKFAELIVQECMNLTEGCRDKYLNSAPFKIAKHFGVE